MSSMDEDKTLVVRALHGDKKAFEMIIQKYQHSLFNYIGRMVREQELALDLTQDVFVKTYASLHQYQPRFKFSTWLFKIASNAVIDHWRKKKIETFSFDQPWDDNENLPRFQIPDNEPSSLKRLELAELKAKIEGALEKIPLHLKELFVWRHINELSYAEMAEIKSLPLGTVKNRVFQAKEMIRRLLEEKE